MCTAVKYGKYFGRTLDFERSFSEELVYLPRDFQIGLSSGEKLSFNYSVIGTACVSGDTPLFFDGMNGAGLCAAALNFPGYAVYRKGRVASLNLASFEVMSYILGSFSSVNEAKIGLRSLCVTDASFSRELPPTALHWMVADREDCIVIEPMSGGVKIYENKIGVMTNSPDFNYHLTRLSDYPSLSQASEKNGVLSHLSEQPYSRGLSALGLPGDWSSNSRFVRAAFLKSCLLTEENDPKPPILRILEGVSVPRGCVMTESGDPVKTIYTCYADMEEKKYFLKTYDGRRYSLDFPISRKGFARLKL